MSSRTLKVAGQWPVLNPDCISGRIWSALCKSLHDFGQARVLGSISAL